MKFVLGFVSLCVLLAIQDATAATIKAPDPPASQTRFNSDGTITYRGHDFDEGENTGIGGVNNGNKGMGSGGSSGHIEGLIGYGGGNEGGRGSIFQGR